MNPKESKILRLEKFYNILMLVGLICILIAPILIVFEFYQATSFCDSQNAKYSFKAFSLSHFCNGKQIYLYGNEWDYDRNINLSMIYP